MLLTVAIGLLFGYANADNMCPNKGDTPLANGGTNNYVIDWLYLSVDDFISFPYAINQCTSHSLASSGVWFMHTCVKGQAFTQQFSDSGCKTAASEATQVTSGNADWYGYYECNGLDTYAQLGLGVVDPSQTSCPPLTTVYAGLAGCTDAISQNVADFSMYCDSSQQTVDVQWFVSALANAKSSKHGSKMLTFASGSSSGELQSSAIPVHPVTTSDGPVTTQYVGVCNSDNYCFDSTITTTCGSVDEWGYVWAQYQGCTGSPNTKNVRKGAVQMHISILGLIVAAVAIFLH